MTGPEVLEFAKATQVALLPMGSIEMHGPHLATGVDTVAAIALAEKAAQIEKAIVLPPIHYNLNAPMKCYPGTLSMPVRMIADMVMTISAEAARNGFDRMICVIGHGGTQLPVGLAQQDLLEQRTGARNSTEARRMVFYVYFGALCKEACKSVLESKPMHGCEYETSLTMQIRPDMVRPEKAHSGPYVPDGVDAAHVDDWNRMVPLGFAGEPQKATAEKGKALLDEAVESLVKVIRQVKAYKLEPDGK